MSILLPEKEEILPITENWSTFYDVGFINDFDKLEFKEKLQIVTDIVRQTILYDEFPNPQNEEASLKGDSYTASKVLINYLKELNIGENHRCALAQYNIFETNPLNSMHFITLVENDGKTYQIDCTPSIGYKCGQVEDIKINKFYDSYTELDNDNLELLNIIRTILYKIHHEPIDDINIKKYLKFLNNFSYNHILNNYVFKCLHHLCASAKDETLKQTILCNEINYLIRNKQDSIVTIDGIVYSNMNAYNEIRLLKDELNTLISENKDYKRQLEIAQCITGELIKYNKRFDKKLKLDNKSIRFTNINPRLFFELGLNVVLLKPSSFKAGVADYIKEKYIGEESNTIGEYYPNLGSTSELLGLKQMRLFHTCGSEYERSMYGPNDLFLVKAKADVIKNIKKELRASLAKEFENKELIWYDGKKIIWDPIILNLVHTTDDPSEASLHYLSGYPEYQLMTRFMYPNPRLRVLEKEKKYERV